MIAIPLFSYDSRASPYKTTRGQCLYNHMLVMCQHVPMMRSLSLLGACLQLLPTVNTNVRR